VGSYGYGNSKRWVQVASATQRVGFRWLCWLKEVVSSGYGDSKRWVKVDMVTWRVGFKWLWWLIKLGLNYLDMAIHKVRTLKACRDLESFWIKWQWWKRKNEIKGKTKEGKTKNKIEVKKGEEKNENFGKFKPSKAPFGPNASDAFFLSYNRYNT
jgi:hypothetical protein